jgi:hypothetical protein
LDSPPPRVKYSLVLFCYFTKSFRDLPALNFGV